MLENNANCELKNQQNMKPMDCYFDAKTLNIFKEYGKVKNEINQSMRYSVGEDFTRERFKFVSHMLLMNDMKIKKS